MPFLREYVCGGAKVTFPRCLFSVILSHDHPKEDQLGQHAFYLAGIGPSKAAAKANGTFYLYIGGCLLQVLPGQVAWRADNEYLYAVRDRAGYLSGFPEQCEL